MNHLGPPPRWTRDEEQSHPEDPGDSVRPNQHHRLPVGVLAPRSQVKVRRFTRSFNLARYSARVEQTRERNRQRLLFEHPETLPSPLSDHEADWDLRTQEQVVDWHQVRQWVRSGRMQLTDLIDVGRGWETVQACVELGEEVDRAVHRSRWGHRLRVVSLTALVFLLPVALLFAAAWIWRWIFGL